MILFNINPVFAYRLNGFKNFYKTLTILLNINYYFAGIEIFPSIPI